METPASMRRVTRSQSAALSKKKSKMQGGEEEEAKRQPLFDITNDSPITGIYIKETPTNRDASSVKTLLQNVEEEKDEVVLSPFEQEEKLNRAFLFNSPDKSELSDTGSDTQETQDPLSSVSDDCSSVWSLQVNDNSEKEELDEEIEEGEELYFHFEEEHEEDEFLYDLCKGMGEICIGEEIGRGKSVNLPEFSGTHTKFVYNSEDEIEEQVIVLRGLPAPEGTHVRFSYEDDE